MGTLTFTELQDEIRSALGGRVDLNARLPRAINLAQQRLARIHDFDEMEILTTTTFGFTSTDADRFLSLPAKREVFSIILLDGAQSKKLKQRTVRFWDNRIPMPEYWNRNRPIEYVLWGDKAEIWPMADAAYSVRIRWSKWPTDLVNPTDVSEFLQKDDILIELAVIYILNSLGKEEDASKHTITLRTLLAEVVTIDDTKPDLDIEPSGNYTPIGDSWLNPFVRF